MSEPPVASTASPTSITVDGAAPYDVVIGPGLGRPGSPGSEGGNEQRGCEEQAEAVRVHEQAPQTRRHGRV